MGSMNEDPVQMEGKMSTSKNFICICSRWSSWRLLANISSVLKKMRHLLLLIPFIAKCHCVQCQPVLFYITKWFTLPQKNKYKIIFHFTATKRVTVVSSPISCYLCPDKIPDKKQHEEGRVYASWQFKKCFPSSHTVSTIRNRVDKKWGCTVKFWGQPLWPASSSRTLPPF